MTEDTDGFGDLPFAEVPLPFVGRKVFFTSTGKVSSLNFPEAIAAIAF
jgi:hypothetical protein